MKTIPFDFEKYKTGNYDVFTRSGSKVENITEAGGTFPLKISFKGVSARFSYTKNGTLHLCDTSVMDLFLVEKQSSLTDKLKNAVILISNEKEFLELKGMYRQIGAEFGFLEGYCYCGPLYWFVRDNNGKEVVDGVHPRSIFLKKLKKDKTFYNSLQDYNGNKPAPSEKRIEFISGYAILKDDTAEIYNGTGEKPLTFSKATLQKLVSALD